MTLGAQNQWAYAQILSNTNFEHEGALVNDVIFVGTHTFILSARGPLRLMGIQTTINVAKIDSFRISSNSARLTIMSLRI